MSPTKHIANDDDAARFYIDEILKLEEIDVGLYRGHTPFTTMNRHAVYGGQLVAQALVAAARTVSDDAMRVHSLHASFLRPSRNDLPLVYRVDEARQRGAHFAVRHVRASQAGHDTFYMTASFQRRGMGGLSHQQPMPPAPDPMSVPNDPQRLLEMSKDSRLPACTRSSLQLAAKMPFPVDVRRVDPAHMFFPTKLAPTQMVWMKSRGALPDTPIIHQCVAAYASDSATVGTMLRPHSISYGDKRLRRAASLDHSMWFHEEDFRADDWLLYHLESPRTSCSRGLVLGHIYDRAGRLVVSVAQEGYLSLVDHPETPSKL